MPLHRIETPSEELHRRLQVLARYAGPKAVAALAGLLSEPAGPRPVLAEGLSSADRAPVERELRALRANDLNVRAADTVAALAAAGKGAERHRLRFGLTIVGDMLKSRGLVHPNEAIVAELQAFNGPGRSASGPDRGR
jgi:hypothetical protein